MRTAVGSGAAPGPGHGTWISSRLAHTEALLQVSVTAREDVPAFGPPLPSPPVFQKVGHSPPAPLISKLQVPMPERQGWQWGGTWAGTLAGPSFGRVGGLYLGSPPPLLLLPAWPSTGSHSGCSNFG